MSLNDKLTDLKQKGKRVAGVAGAAANVIAEDIKNKVSKREGIVGKIADAVDQGIQKGKDMHQDILAKGGYKSAVESGIESILERYDTMSSKIESALFTDGQYDPAKANELLSKGSDLGKEYGAKAANYISKMTAKGVKILKANLSDYIVPLEERKTTYAGIGSKYGGFLFRQQFEDCLRFYKQADKKISSGSKYKTPLLIDIKESASANFGELADFYSKRIKASKDQLDVQLLATATKYLAK
jgi:hypothetical protein